MEDWKFLNKVLAIFFGLQIFFVLSMFLIYLIPNNYIENYTREGLDYINKFEKSQSGGYLPFFFNEPGSMLDCITDSTMLSLATHSGGGNTLQRAMVPRYSRYWHGYQVYLRPLLCFFKYSQIRYYIYIISNLLFVLSFYFICRRINLLTGFLWAFSVLLARFCIVSVSLQFMICFNIMFIAVIWLCLMKKACIRDIRKMAVYFFVIGAITNFMDFLTVPMLTLGIPLIIYLFIVDTEDSWTPFIFKKIVLCTLSWCGAYSMTWVFKWCLSSIVLKINVMENAVAQGMFRALGNSEKPLNRALMYKNNISYILGGKKVGIVIILLIFVLWGIAMLTAHKPWRTCMRMMPVLILAIYPYIWYGVMANHSDIHSWFTYRLQIISIFSGLSWLGYCIDMDSIKRKIYNMRLYKD